MRGAYIENTSAKLSAADKNANKQLVKFGISMPFQYFMYILGKLNTFSRSWKPISQFTTFPILSIPRGSPGSGVVSWQRSTIRNSGARAN